jgi:hypothetical protein
LSTLQEPFDDANRSIQLWVALATLMDPGAGSAHCLSGYIPEISSEFPYRATSHPTTEIERY